MFTVMNIGLVIEGFSVKQEGGGGIGRENASLEIRARGSWIKPRAGQVLS